MPVIIDGLRLAVGMVLSQVPITTGDHPVGVRVDGLWVVLVRPVYLQDQGCILNPIREILITAASLLGLERMNPPQLSPRLEKLQKL